MADRRPSWICGKSQVVRIAPISIPLRSLRKNRPDCVFLMFKFFKMAAVGAVLDAKSGKSDFFKFSWCVHFSRYIYVAGVRIVHHVKALPLITCRILYGHKSAGGHIGFVGKNRLLRIAPISISLRSLGKNRPECVYLMFKFFKFSWCVHFSRYSYVAGVRIVHHVKALPLITCRILYGHKSAGGHIGLSGKIDFSESLRFRFHCVPWGFSMNLPYDVLNTLCEN